MFPAWGAPNEDLLQAARKGNVKAVQILLDAGADVNASNEDGETALMLAARVSRQFSDLAEAIEAVRVADHPGIVRVLLQAGADVSVAQVIIPKEETL